MIRGGDHRGFVATRNRGLQPRAKREEVRLCRGLIDWKQLHGLRPARVRGRGT